MNESIITLHPPKVPRGDYFTRETLLNLLHTMEEVIGEIHSAHHSLLQASHDLDEAKHTLEAARTRMLLEGVEGANAAVRDATLYALTEQEREAVRAAERTHSACKRDAELLHLELGLIKAQLRAHEVAIALYQEGGAA